MTSTRVPEGGPSGVLRLQQRTVGVLMASQVLGGVGAASGIAVGALLAAEISGRDDLSGLATTTQVLGAAVLTVPVAALMAARGRRAGLVLAYLLAGAGAALAVAATALGSFAALLVGTALFGAATTATNQARYAATDLAEPTRRGRHLGLVVWATTIGAVAGPNLVGPGAVVASRAGLPQLTGVLLLSTAGFVAAAALLAWLLRPDPLLTARSLVGRRGDPLHPEAVPAPPARRSVWAGAGTIVRTPAALRGTVAVTGGHVVMVSVMVMTPLHMTHGHAAVEVIGFVISVHILGMFGLAPVVGYLSDRWGPPRVVLVGASLLLVASVLAGTSEAGWSPGLLAGLFLLGLGWSCTMVAGSGQVAGSVPLVERPSVQGAADLVMGLCAAAAGALAGVVVASLGYAVLCALAGVLALGLGSSVGTRRPVVNLSG